MREKRRVVFVCIFIILSVLFSRQAVLSQDAINLSGKYKGYNVILIILDALRPDHLSCYGYAKQTSPNIDALAREGALFKNAFSQASYTLPSVTSIFTSVYPYSHGVRYVSKDKVPEKLYTLAQVLGMYGYKTAWFGKLKDPHTAEADGVLKGFNEKYQEENFEEGAGRLFWIKKHKAEPFFITIHSYLPHENTFPFIKIDNEFYRGIPRDFLDSFVEIKKKCWNKLQDMLGRNQDKINDVFGRDWIRENKQYLMSPYSDDAFDRLDILTQNSAQRRLLNQINSDIVYSFFRSFNNKQLSSFKSLFDSVIYEIDKKIVGDLVEQLKELGLYDKTIIIITADHGNEFMEHGEFGHGKAVYDESIHVPLIYYIPKIKKTVVLKGLVESVDILPTTLGLLSIPALAQSQGINLSGLIEGKSNNIPVKEYVFSQGAPAGTIAIRSKNWKLLLQPRDSESLEVMLFNLKKDPSELCNVIKKNPEVAAQFKSRLAAWQESLVVHRQSVADEFVAEVDDATKDRIKNTGYW